MALPRWPGELKTTTKSLHTKRIILNRRTATAITKTKKKINPTFFSLLIRPLFHEKRAVSGKGRKKKKKSRHQDEQLYGEKKTEHECISTWIEKQHRRNAIADRTAQRVLHPNTKFYTSTALHRGLKVKKKKDVRLKKKESDLTPGNVEISESKGGKKYKTVASPIYISIEH